jgi:hypothetical protein
MPIGMTALTFGRVSRRSRTFGKAGTGARSGKPPMLPKISSLSFDAAA